MIKHLAAIILVLMTEKGLSQNLDSLYIAEYEDDKEPDKVLHAEPLYIDLIRDLGVRKGEKEWNVGLGMTDNLDYDTYEALVEYEFAPIDRLGLEIEVPFLIYSGNEEGTPNDKAESLKLAAQWSFLVSEKISTSLALGYIHEFEFSDFENFGDPMFTGNIFNPFMVTAKRWGNNFHTLIYTGPIIEKEFNESSSHFSYEINSNIHYMVPKTRNFIGIEFNKELEDGGFDMVMRPQMRLGISEDLMVGIVTGIPISKEKQRLSAFVRLIWEPGEGH